MIKKISIDYKIGFADSSIISYHSDDDNLVVFIRCWNENILKCEFIDRIYFQINNSWDISDICETEDENLITHAIKIIYDKLPERHPYHLFQFLNFDEDPVVNIVAQSINITPVDGQRRIP